VKASKQATMSTISSASFFNACVGAAENGCQPGLPDGIFSKQKAKIG
jgi:hypothetical protein